MARNRNLSSCSLEMPSYLTNTDVLGINRLVETKKTLPKYLLNTHNRILSMLYRTISSNLPAEPKPLVQHRLLTPVLRPLTLTQHPLTLSHRLSRTPIPHADRFGFRRPSRS